MGQIDKRAFEEALGIKPAGKWEFTHKLKRTYKRVKASVTERQLPEVITSETRGYALGSRRRHVDKRDSKVYRKKRLEQVAAQQVFDDMSIRLGRIDLTKVENE